MSEMDPTSHNPKRQFIIAGSAGDVARMVTAFTEASLGIPLSALDNRDTNWERKKVLAIPEKMKTIFGRFQDQ